MWHWARDAWSGTFARLTNDKWPDRWPNRSVIGLELFGALRLTRWSASNWHSKWHALRISVRGQNHATLSNSEDNQRLPVQFAFGSISIWFLDLAKSINSGNSWSFLVIGWSNDWRESSAIDRYRVCFGHFQMNHHQSIAFDGGRLVW